MARADSWAPPEIRAVASEDGRTIFRVVPGTNMEDRFGPAGGRGEGYAEGQWYRFQDGAYARSLVARLRNPIAPVAILVANDGTAITLDNWYGTGQGEVVVIYDPEGRVRRSYRLSDLYAADLIARMPRSLSSIDWRCAQWASRLSSRGAGALWVVDSLGGQLKFDLQTGDYEYLAGAAPCAR